MVPLGPATNGPRDAETPGPGPSAEATSDASSANGEVAVGDPSGPDADHEPAQTSFVADSLALGMAVMLGMTIIQRGLGFFRGIWFCRLMDEGDVGAWSMAYDFIVMMTPIALLGIPGSLARYVEHFRQMGHLTPMVRRLAMVTAALGVGLVAMMLTMPSWFGWLIFLQPDHTSLVISVAAGVAAIIYYNFIYELVASLRQVRIASLMQFVQSVGFSIAGIAWLYAGGKIAGLVGVFVAATVLATGPGCWTLIRGWSGVPQSSDRFVASAMWRRLLPYAGALWVMNLLTNVFDLSDRYMILHWMPGTDEVTRAAVGQYHSGRIIPLLLMSLGTMISGVLMPYLAADWEKGRRADVVERLKQTMFGMSVVFTAGAAITLWIAPWLFGTLLEGRYTDGLALMPMAFVFCIWSALVNVGQDYLWVNEKGKWAGLFVAVGLVANVALNLLLLPTWGLSGAAFATMVANGVVVAGLWVAMIRNGFDADWPSLSLTVLPATLLAGPPSALACSILLVAVTPQAHRWLEPFVGKVWSRLTG